MFPSPKYPNLKEVSDAGKSSSLHLSSRCSFRPQTLSNNKQLLDEVEQNIVICQWRADQLFADAEGRGK